MSKKNKNGLVPSLRFPEFNNTGEWKRNKLEEIAEFYKGKGISKANISKNGHQPCIRYGELYTVYGDVIDEVLSRTDITSDNLYLSKAGDVILPSSGETKIDIATAACVVHEGIALGSDLNVIRSEQNGVFLSYYLNGALKYEIAKVAQGDTVVHLYKRNLESLDLALPPLLKEQQKIADCLSSLDELITLHTKKHEALQLYKKGLMQNLFPANGETVPTLRFPEFEEAGDWGAKKFAQLCHFVRGPFGGALKKDIFVSDGYAVYEQSHAIYNDIIMSCSGTMGKFSIIPDDFRNGVINQALLKLTVKVGHNLKFIKHTLELPDNQEKLLSQSAGGAIKNVVGVSLMKEIELFIPSDGEQQKIADCLSSVDDLIITQAQKVEELKAHKKGLMQQLFPSAGEVDA